MTDENPTVPNQKSFPLRLTDPVIEEGVWPCLEDRLERHKEIENLSPVIQNAQAPLVFAIDAPWGGGNDFTGHPKILDKYSKINYNPHP